MGTAIGETSCVDGIEGCRLCHCTDASAQILGRLGLVTESQDFFRNIARDRNTIFADIELSSILFSE